MSEMSIRLTQLGVASSGVLKIDQIGAGQDGALGIEAVKKMGGTTVAQNEETAEHSGMPSAAIATHKVDFVLALDEIPPALVTLVMKEEGTSE